MYACSQQRSLTQVGCDGQFSSRAHLVWIQNFDWLLNQDERTKLQITGGRTDRFVPFSKDINNKQNANIVEIELGLLISYDENHNFKFVD